MGEITVAQAQQVLAMVDAFLAVPGNRDLHQSGTLVHVARRLEGQLARMDVPGAIFGVSSTVLEIRTRAAWLAHYVPNNGRGSRCAELIAFINPIYGLTSLR